MTTFLGRAAVLHECLNPVRHGFEAVDHDVALCRINPYGHIEAAAVQFLVEHFRIAMQPADAGAVGGVDPELALRGTNAKFERRFGYIERTLSAQGRAPAAASLAEMDALWDEAKVTEKPAYPAIPGRE
jgi:hypothetical protein